MMTSENVSSRRFPAEWEMDGAVLLAWPHKETDWAYMLDEVRECFRDMVRAIVPWSKVVIVAPDIEEPRRFLGGAESDGILYFTAETNDTWTRDYGPLSVIEHGTYKALDFKFNGWGLKFASCHDNRIVRNMAAKGLISCELENHQDFVLEGGGIETDGRGMLMTTAECQLSANRNAALTREDVKNRLIEYFGAKDCIWLNHGYLAGDDTDSHIDTLARFAPGDTIIYTGCDNELDEHYHELKLMEEELKEARTLEGKPFNLIRLPLPDAVYDEDGDRLPATYANFLALPQAVIMPTYNQPKNDELARQMMQIAFDVPVITVDCRALIRQHGSFHCMTMQMPKEILPI